MPLPYYKPHYSSSLNKGFLTIINKCQNTFLVNISETEQPSLDLGMAELESWRLHLWVQVPVYLCIISQPETGQVSI